MAGLVAFAFFRLRKSSPPVDHGLQRKPPASAEGHGLLCELLIGNRCGDRGSKKSRKIRLKRRSEDVFLPLKG